jgi:hypothetical protein
LSKIARLAKQVLIVETQLDARNAGRPAMIFYPGAELNGDKTNWWGPNEACMEALLHVNGFCDVEAGAHPTVPDFRGIFHAWRDPACRIKPISQLERIRPPVDKVRPSLMRRAISKSRRLAGS